jgi:cobyrinic acid a,c-diamide synthase
MNYPRVMIAGVHSSVGKTTVSLGMMSALYRRGMRVQAFKVGPDYIDPGLHFYATGNKSHNLDCWMGSSEIVKTIFGRNAQVADVSIVEGVMGFYDGARGEGIKGSSADIAMLLKIPVILVLNARGMAQSCVAMVKGFIEYHPEANIQGVILNQATDFHKNWVKPNLEDELGIQVLGCLPKDKRISMPERHLGLLPADENNEITNNIQQMADLIEGCIDLDALLKIARSAVELLIESEKSIMLTKVKIGVARDRAFSFYYQDSLDYLQDLGAELVFFSPLDDTCLPLVDGLYIGGGFPEMFLNELSSNESMLKSMREANQNGMPIFAECGGFMYLCRQITDWDSKNWDGAGIIPAQIKMTRHLQALGYVQATTWQDSIVSLKGDTFRGHEFHYSTVEGINPDKSAFSLAGGRRLEKRNDGYVEANVFASYVHLHLRSNSAVAENFLKTCTEYANRSR